MQEKMKTHLAILTPILSFSLAGAGAAKADQLTSAELRKLVPGHYHVSVADNVKLDVRLLAGGGIAATTDKGDHDTGRWSIANDKMCVVFKRWLDHQTHCQAIRLESGLLRGDGFTIRR